MSRKDRLPDSEEQTAVTVDTVQVPRANPRPPGPEDRAARRVAWERSRRGWSTAELARRMTDAGVPVNQSSIYKIENGEPRRTISLDEAHALAGIFGLTIEQLESAPDDLIAADLAEYLDELDRIESVTDDLRTHILRVLERTAGTAESARPLLEYMGTEPNWPVIGKLEDDLTRLADLIIKVRDAVTQLRLPSRAD
jgi:transcriptional regulator with XRE-family HTH domain